MMESSAVVQHVPHESAIDPGVIIAELHQTEQIETVVVAGDFIELGSTYETTDQATADAGNDGAQVFEVINVEQPQVSENCGELAN